jgi:hypothetical protein
MMSDAAVENSFVVHLHDHRIKFREIVYGFYKFIPGKDSPAQASMPPLAEENCSSLKD